MQALYVLWILCGISGYAARAAYPDIWQMLFDSASSLQHWRSPRPAEPVGARVSLIVERRKLVVTAGEAVRE